MGTPWVTICFGCLARTSDRCCFATKVCGAQRREIDKLVFTDLPGAQAPPSDMLAQLYQSATVEEVESDLGHPRAPEGTASEPHLHLGDIFVAEGRQEVLVIVNAQCDLEFAPGVESRPFRPDRAIVMIPGELQLLRESLRSSDVLKPRTEVFRHENECFRIVWEPKRVMSVPYGDISNWLRKTIVSTGGQVAPSGRPASSAGVFLPT